MASKYAKQMKIPAEFPQIVKDFTREALRNQGEPQTELTLLNFAAKYFRQQVLDRETRSNNNNNNDSQEASILTTMSNDDVKVYVERIFKAADADGNGSLDHREFKKIFKSMSDHLNLTPVDIQRILSEADENTTGTIEFAEFVPIAVEIIQSLGAQDAYTKTQQERSGKAVQIARDVLLHGMPRKQVMELLQEIFERSDLDGNGTLSRSEFKSCMKDADLGFSRREVNVLMSRVDVTGDGLVSYAEFVPLCFELLVQMFANELVEVPKNEVALTAIVLQIFQRSDTTRSGKLSIAAIKGALRAADLGLTRIQISAVMAEAREEEEGGVEYATFADTVGGMVIAMIGLEQQHERKTMLHAHRETQEYHLVFGLHQHDFENALGVALESLGDHQRGTLSRGELCEMLANTFPDISDRQLRALLAIAATEGPGQLSYGTLLDQAFETLQYLNEHDTITAQ